MCIDLILVFMTAVAHLGLPIFHVLFPHPLFLVPAFGDLWPGDKPRWPWKAKPEEMALHLRSYLPYSHTGTLPFSFHTFRRAWSLIEYTLLDACSVLSAGCREQCSVLGTQDEEGMSLPLRGSRSFGKGSPPNNKTKMVNTATKAFWEHRGINLSWMERLGSGQLMKSLL